MARGGLGLFLLEAGAGTALLLLFFPVKTLGKGFFSMHGALAFLFVLLAALLHPIGLPSNLGWAATGLLAAFTIAAHANRARTARPLLGLGGLCAAAAMVSVAASAPQPSGSSWTILNAFIGSLFFGAALLTMNLGHWYLVSRSLPFRLLTTGALVFGILALLRAVFMGLTLAVNPRPEGLAVLLAPERDALFFLFRVLWGIVGPLALSYFIWRSAEMKSNQAATGLLYVALVFVLIGEMLSSYLTVATGFPA